MIDEKAYAAIQSKLDGIISVRDILEAYEAAKPKADVVEAFIKRVEQIAFSMPAPNSYTPQFIQLCIEMKSALAALPQQAAVEPVQPDGCAEIATQVTAPLREIIARRNSYPNPDKTSNPHITWMLEQIEARKVTGDKAHRWLGYVQGVMAVRGWIDVDQERERTRPYLTQPKRESGSDRHVALLQEYYDASEHYAEIDETSLRETDRSKFYELKKATMERFDKARAALNATTRVEDGASNG